MTTMTKLVIGATILAALMASLLLLQQQALARARAEQAELLNRVPDPPPVVQPPDSVAASGNNPPAELAELEALRRETSELRQRISQFSTQALAIASASASPRTNDLPVLETVRTSEARDSGQATPAALIQTFLWAISHGETNRIPQLLEFESGLNSEEAQRFLDAMVRELGKAGAQGDGPMEVRVLAESSAGGNDRWITTQDLRREGTWREPEKVRFRLTDGGWKLLVGTNGEPVSERQP
jgi:hypothetical protein